MANLTNLKERQARVVDIETIPNLEQWARLGEPEVTDKRLKDPVKIAEKKEALIKKQLGDMALHPVTGRICAAAIVDINKSGQIVDRNGLVLDAVSDDSENVLIRDLSAMLDLSEWARPLIVTFNGISFDIPFIYGRCMMLKARAPRPSIGDLTKRYSTRHHYDIRMMLNNWDSHAKGSLDYFENMIMDVRKDEPDYSKFLDYFKAGTQKKDILEPCIQHAEITADLYLRVSPYYN
ncbi:MAG: hypothetical protein U9Q21_02540 [Candidatus Auribacterota bacterium]|nr:hypothetical protein [Candidatus Auribacterota bacterium]